MPIVKVQFERTIIDSGGVRGKWDVYSSAYFDAPANSPGLAIRTLIQRMFLGLPRSSGSTVGRTNLLIPGATGARLTSWEYVAPLLVNTGEFTDALLSNNATASSANLGMPTQCCIAIGYKTVDQVPRQRGRSRWWNGPLYLRTDQVMQSGGMRLLGSIVNLYAFNASDCIDALADLGWVLQVKTGPLASATFDDAVELYVDDVIDVMRSRRGWQQHQERISL
jgi:hypothetical protein